MCRKRDFFTALLSAQERKDAILKGRMFFASFSLFPSDAHRTNCANYRGVEGEWTKSSFFPFRICQMLGRRCFYRPWLVTLLRRKGGELADGGVGGGLPGFVPFIRGRRRPKRPLISLISSSPLFSSKVFLHPRFPNWRREKTGGRKGKGKTQWEVEWRNLDQANQER